MNLTNEISSRELEFQIKHKFEYVSYYLVITHFPTYCTKQSRLISSLVWSEGDKEVIRFRCQNCNKEKIIEYEEGKIFSLICICKFEYYYDPNNDNFLIRIKDRRETEFKWNIEDVFNNPNSKHYYNNIII